ncbi:MAG: peptide deformylase [Deltaproteobacteria bacterium]|nr:peptide deformylase [Deltaproteobacteria bacterium]
MTEENRKAPLPPLVTMGDPRLSRPSEPVDPANINTPVFQARLQLLARCMTEYIGIGIAAPQIGWFRRVFLILDEDEDESEQKDYQMEAWINPEIVEFSAEQGWAWEGCLSVPGLRGWIRRPLSIRVRGLDAGGDEVSREIKGWPARVFQHEFDHLDGMLFPYRAVDTRHLVMLEELEKRQDWPDDWPAPGAARAPMGVVIPD